MTRNQVRWAATHDWFLSSSERNGSVTVADVRYDAKTQAVTSSLRTFTDFRSLYAWAGY